jgi:hypothetical protein
LGELVEVFSLLWIEKIAEDSAHQLLHKYKAFIYYSQVTCRG